MDPAPPSLPDATGHFGPYGGMFVPETLMAPLQELAGEYERARIDPEFQDTLRGLLADYCGRPTPLYFAERWTGKMGGAKVYLKREDLLHTGAHKINNAIGQALMAKRLGKKRIIAETGAGQHGVATATVCARFGLECVIYMGAVDMERQAPNVTRMRLLGARVEPVTAGQATLKEAVSEAMRDWTATVEHTHYILGSALGSHPFPMMVRDFHRVIGEEARRQVLAVEGRLPDLLVACVGGGSNAIGLFHPFLEDEEVRMVGVEAGGEGIRPARHAARFQGGKLGVLQGTKTWLLADQDGQIESTTPSAPAWTTPRSVRSTPICARPAGWSTPTPPTRRPWRGSGSFPGRRASSPALESAHAIAYLSKVAPHLPASDVIIANLSGRGDKDMEQACRFLAGESGEPS